MEKYFQPDSVEIIAYCLMPNHYHLLVSLCSDNFSMIMHPLVVAYAKSINKRYQRTGALFQGRFKRVHIDKDSYLLHLSRYIHLNPAHAGLVARPDQWAFSSYLDFLGLRSGTNIKPDIILSQFDSPNEYRHFVESDQDATLIKHLIF